MAYKSKYTGLQIDDILDSVGSKQNEIEDLDQIRAGAEKGATALQSYTEKYTGTVTGIKINGETKSGSGVIDLGTISTDISGKQDKLVDGVNIATINGQSLIEGGDLIIESGSQSMVSTTWAELKAMRDSASLVAGTWYRITDYVTTTSQVNTISANHPFDVAVLATGENTLSEEARAVRHEGEQVTSLTLESLPHSFMSRGTLVVDDVEWFKFEAIIDGTSAIAVSSSANPVVGDMLYPYYEGTIDTSEALPIASVDEIEDEYFLNNKVNLDSWKIWYCLDNDKARFPWAVAKTKKSIVVQIDEATLLTAEYNGTYEYEGVMYYRWDAFYSGTNILFLTVSDNPETGGTTSVYGSIEQNIFLPYPMTIMSVNEPSENEGFGVIYRMIDERGNDCPYDFKNIQFLVPITGGQIDDENGTEEWVFTFNLNSGDGSASTDYSNTSYCFNNIIKSALLGLNFNIFLNNTVMTQCYNNSLANGCMYNVFNDGCYNNTLGNECMYNLFERYTCRCNVAPNVQSETITNNFGYTTEARVAYDSSNTLKIYCEADVTGDYNDLTNKPTIPAAVTESTVSGWGFIKNTDTYTKPSTGIPKSDLASAVQTSLEKADTALQSYTEQYKGTVTGVKINGTTKNPSNGVVDLGTVITSHQTLKTISGESIVGSGDITISVGSSAYSEVNHGTEDTTFTLTPNTFHVWDEVASLTLDFGSETSGVANEFLFQFISGATATSLTLPDDIKWANDSAPTIEANMIYQVSVLKGLASVLITKL